MSEERGVRVGDIVCVINFLYAQVKWKMFEKFLCYPAVKYDVKHGELVRQPKCVGFGMCVKDYAERHTHFQTHFFSNIHEYATHIHTERTFSMRKLET